MLRTLLLVAIVLFVCTSFLLPRISSVIEPPLQHERCPCVFLDEVEWRSGDLLLYQTNPFINFTSSAGVSHVGMVVVSGGDSTPYVLEITPGSKHPRIRPLYSDLHSVIEKRGVVLHRSISSSLPVDRVLAYLDGSHASLTYSHTSYVSHYLSRLFASPLFLPPLPRRHESLPSQKSKSRAFCSTLVRDVLIHCGVLAPGSPAVFPWDFLSARLATLPHVEYSRERRVVNRDLVNSTVTVTVEKEDERAKTLTTDRNPEP